MFAPAQYSGLCLACCICCASEPDEALLIRRANSNCKHEQDGILCPTLRVGSSWHPSRLFYNRNVIRGTVLFNKGSDAVLKSYWSLQVSFIAMVEVNVLKKYQMKIEKTVCNRDWGQICLLVRCLPFDSALCHVILTRFSSNISFQKAEKWVITITGSADSAVFNIVVDVKKAFWSHGQPGPSPKDKKYKNVEIWNLKKLSAILFHGDMSAQWNPSSNKNEHFYHCFSFPWWQAFEGQKSEIASAFGTYTHV